jgi:hypothetical protein
MSTNTLNSGSLQGLQMDQTLMVSARKVAGAKVQLEFAEVLQKESNQAVNPLALFNEGDSRFSQSGGARRAWMTVEPLAASKYLGLDLTDTNTSWTVDSLGREILMLNVLNPVAFINGEAVALKVEVAETTSANEYQADNVATAAKRRGKDGAYCTHKGMYIFANTRIAFNKANHVFLEMDAVASSTSTKSIVAIPALSVNDSPFN